MFMCWSLGYQVMDSHTKGYWISRALTSSFTDWLIICCHYWGWWKLVNWVLEEVCCWECDCVVCVWSANSFSSFLLPGHSKRANFGSPHALALAILSFTPPRNCGAGVSRTGGRRQNKSFLLWVVFLKYFVTVTKHYLICSLSQCMRISVISFMVLSISLCTTLSFIHHASVSVAFFLFPEVEFLPRWNAICCIFFWDVMLLDLL